MLHNHAMEQIDRHALSATLTEIGDAFERGESVVLSPRAKYLINEGLQSVDCKTLDHSLRDQATQSGCELAIAASTHDRSHDEDRAFFSAALRDLAARLARHEGKPDISISQPDQPITHELPARKDEDRRTEPAPEPKAEVEAPGTSSESKKPSPFRVAFEVCRTALLEAGQIIRESLLALFQKMLAHADRTRTPDIIPSLPEGRTLTIAPIRLTGNPVLTDALWATSSFIPIGPNGAQVPLQSLAKELGLAAPELPRPELMSKLGPRRSFEADAESVVFRSRITLPLPIEARLVGLSFTTWEGREVPGTVISARFGGGVEVRPPFGVRKVTYRVALSDKEILDSGTFEKLRSFSRRYFEHNILSKEDHALTDLESRVRRLAEKASSAGLIYWANPVVAKTLRLGSTYLSSSMAGLRAGTCDPIAVFGACELGSLSTVGLVLTGFVPEKRERGDCDSILTPHGGHAMTLLKDSHSERPLDLTQSASDEETKLTAAIRLQLVRYARSLPWKTSSECIESGKLVRAELDRHRRSAGSARDRSGETTLQLPMDLRLQCRELISIIQTAPCSDALTSRAIKLFTKVEKTLEKMFPSVHAEDCALSWTLQHGMIDAAWRYLDVSPGAADEAVHLRSADQIMRLCIGPRNFKGFEMRPQIPAADFSDCIERTKKLLGSGRLQTLPRDQREQIVAMIAAIAGTPFEDTPGTTVCALRFLHDLLPLIEPRVNTPSEVARMCHKVLTERAKSGEYIQEALPLFAQLSPAFRGHTDAWYSGFFLESRGWVENALSTLIAGDPSGPEEAAKHLSSHIAKFLLTPSFSGSHNAEVLWAQARLLKEAMRLGIEIDLKPWSAELLHSFQRQTLEAHSARYRSSKTEVMGTVLPRESFPIARLAHRLGYLSHISTMAEILISQGVFSAEQFASAEICRVEPDSAEYFLDLLARSISDMRIRTGHSSRKYIPIGKFPSVIHHLPLDPQWRDFLAGLQPRPSNVDPMFRSVLQTYPKEAKPFLEELTKAHPTAAVIAIAHQILPHTDFYRALLWCCSQRHNMPSDAIVDSAAQTLNFFIAAKPKTVEQALTAAAGALAAQNFSLPSDINPLAACAAWCLTGDLGRLPDGHQRLYPSRFFLFYKRDVTAPGPITGRTFWEGMLRHAEIRPDSIEDVREACSDAIAQHVKSTARVSRALALLDSNHVSFAARSSSGEVFDRRSYSQGEDARDIDHTYLARTNQVVVKMYETRTRFVNTHIILDPEFVIERAAAHSGETGDRRLDELARLVALAAALDAEGTPYNFHLFWRGVQRSFTAKSSRDGKVLSSSEAFLTDTAQMVQRVNFFFSREMEISQDNPFESEGPMRQLGLTKGKGTVYIVAVGSRNFSSFKRELDVLRRSGAQVILLRSRAVEAEEDNDE